MLYVYLILCLITAVINLGVYYDSKLREAFKTATKIQIIGAMVITFSVSFVLAPMLFIDFIIYLIKKKRGIQS